MRGKNEETGEVNIIYRDMWTVKYIFKGESKYRILNVYTEDELKTLVDGLKKDKDVRDYNVKYTPLK